VFAEVFSPDIIIVAVLYFVPSVIALVRRSDRTGLAILINVLLGWSVLGWLVALYLALTGTRPSVASDSA